MRPLIDSAAIKAVQEALTPLAEKIGTGASHLYGVFIRQSLVEGIVELIIFLVMAGSSLIIFKHVKDGSKDMDPEDKSAENIVQMTLSIIFSVVAICLLVSSISHLTTGILKAGNPEYYAIQNLIQQLKAR